MENGTSNPVAMGRLLAEARHAHGLTQNDLGAMVGLDSMHISQFECGHKRPTRTQLDKLCAALDVDRDEAHALLGMLPIEVEMEWLRRGWVRKEVRRILDIPSVGP